MATKKSSKSKRELIIASAKRRKRGVEVTVIAEEVNCSTSYVRYVLRDAGYAPTSLAKRDQPLWKAA